MTDPHSAMYFLTKPLSAEELDLRELLWKLGRSGEKDQFWSIINMFDDLNSNGVGAALFIAAITQKWDSAIVKILVDFPRRFFDWTIQFDLPGPVNMPRPLNKTATDETLDTFITIAEGGKVPLTIRDPYDSGRTPLHAACRARAFKVFEYLLKQDEVQNIIDSPDGYGRTPLSYAAQYGHLEMVHQLLSSGKVYWNTEDHAGCTPWEWAIESGDTFEVQVILSWPRRWEEDGVEGTLPSLEYLMGREITD